jgi:hypothetical protein
MRRNDSAACFRTRTIGNGAESGVSDSCKPPAIAVGSGGLGAGNHPNEALANRADPRIDDRRSCGCERVEAGDRQRPFDHIFIHDPVEFQNLDSLVQ